MSAMLIMEDVVMFLQLDVQILHQVSPVLAEMVLKEPLRRVVTLMNALMRISMIVTS